MQSVLSKLFTGTRSDASDYILTEYHRKGYAIVNYLYFANIPGKHLFENHKTQVEKELFEDALLDDYKALSKSLVSSAYKKALLESEIVLPDGIAMQIFYRIAAKLKKITTPRLRLENLNGSDFCLSFLDQLHQEKGAENVQIILYGTYPGILEKTKTFLAGKGYTVVYAQDGYTNLDRDSVEAALKEDPKKYNILLVARSTPEYPIQELWSRANQGRIKKYNLLTFNQAGTFDFRVGVQKRAPKLRRQRKIEWLRRFITDPKRNSKKVLDSLKIIKYIFSYLLLKK